MGEIPSVNISLLSPGTSGQRLPVLWATPFILFSFYSILLGHSIYSLFSILCSLFSILYSPFSILYSLISILYSLFSVLCSLFSILYSPFSILYSLLSILYSLFSILYSLFNSLFSILYSLFSTLYSTPSKPPFSASSIHFLYLWCLCSPWQQHSSWDRQAASSETTAAAAMWWPAGAAGRRHIQGQWDGPWHHWPSSTPSPWPDLQVCGRNIQGQWDGPWHHWPPATLHLDLTFRYVEEIFRGNEMVPDIIDRPPPHYLDLTFRSMGLQYHSLKPKILTG